MTNISKRRRKSVDLTSKSPGRPTLEEQTFLTAEMEEFCQLARAGFSIDEIADKLQIKVEKCLSIQNNAIVQARIRKLFGDKQPRFVLLQDQLFETALEMTIKKFKAIDKDGNPISTFAELWKVITHFIPLEETTRKLSSESLEQGSDSQSNDKESKKSIFKKMEMTEHVTKSKE